MRKRKQKNQVIMIKYSELVAFNQPKDTEQTKYPRRETQKMQVLKNYSRCNIRTLARALG